MPSPAPAPSARLAATIPPARRRVLVVDDSALIRHAATLALERISGFGVLTAGSAEDGLAAAASAEPDAILLDLVMPGTDGMAVVRGHRARRPAAVAAGVVGASTMPASADHGPGTPVSEFLSAIWNGHRERVQQRFEAISVALDALAHDELGTEQRAAAERAAHMVAGAGGTFGFARATEVVGDAEADRDQLDDGGEDFISPDPDREELTHVH